MGKIIVLDLDGTLLRDDKKVSENTVNTLLQVKEQNNRIIFATARPPRDAYKYVPKELRDNPIICYNGACIIDNKENVLYSKQISREDALRIIKVAKRYGFDDLCFEINDKLYSTFDTYEFFGDALNQIIDLEKLEFESVYKIIVCSKQPIPTELVEEIKKNGKGVITDNGTLCQIMNRDVTKWTCIQSLIEREKIDKKDIIAFGDDNNDYDVIKNAGIGVAMGNAIQSIKEIADYVTESNMDEGVANFINKKM